MAIAVNMRFAAIAALFVCSLGAEPWPFAWGTTPAKVTGSKQARASWTCTRTVRICSVSRGSQIRNRSTTRSTVRRPRKTNAFYTEQRLGKPQEYPEAYRRSSPIHYYSMLKNPFLMVYGIMDNNVMFQDTVQLSEKLIHEGRDFSEIYYPEASHIFVRDETLIDAVRRATEFFDRKLSRE